MKERSYIFTWICQWRRSSVFNVNIEHISHLFLRFILLKLVSAIFIKFLFFHQIIALQKLWKFFLFHPKSSFRSQDIQIFCDFSSSFPHFPDSKGQIRIIYKWNNGIIEIIYDVVNCLAGVISGITQKPLYNAPSNLVR